MRPARISNAERRVLAAIAVVLIMASYSASAILARSGPAEPPRHPASLPLAGPAGASISRSDAASRILSMVVSSARTLELMLSRSEPADTIGEVAGRGSILDSIIEIPIRRAGAIGAGSGGGGNSADKIIYSINNTKIIVFRAPDGKTVAFPFSATNDSGEDAGSGYVIVVDYLAVQAALLDVASALARSDFEAFNRAVAEARVLYSILHTARILAEASRGRFLESIYVGVVSVSPAGGWASHLGPALAFREPGGWAGVYGAYSSDGPNFLSHRKYLTYQVAGMELPVSQSSSWSRPIGIRAYRTYALSFILSLEESLRFAASLVAADPNMSEIILMPPLQMPLLTVGVQGSEEAGGQSRTSTPPAQGGGVAGEDIDKITSNIILKPKALLYGIKNNSIDSNLTRAGYAGGGTLSVGIGGVVRQIHGYGSGWAWRSFRVYRGGMGGRIDLHYQELIAFIMISVMVTILIIYIYYRGILRLSIFITILIDKIKYFIMRIIGVGKARDGALPEPVACYVRAVAVVRPYIGSKRAAETPREYLRRASRYRVPARLYLRLLEATRIYERYRYGGERELEGSGCAKT